MNILMIGNSYCYYFIDELWGMGQAAGVDMRVSCVYYDGCPLDKHWAFLQSGESNYDFRTCQGKEVVSQKGFSLDQCLAADNWDVISFQPGNGAFRRGGAEAARATVEPYLGYLLDYIKPKFPNATYYWQQYWSPEIGNANKIYAIDTVEKRNAFYEAVRTIGLEVHQNYSLPLIPTGDAWQLVRDHPIIREDGKTLCTRNYKGNPLYDDFSHDGDVGGGQYLNACVWFEVLTGKSCIGNEFRPEEYFLSEEKIAILQQAAHAAVAGVYGGGYAK